MSKRILVPLAEGCEELEAVTIIDLLRRAELDVTIASLDATAVTGNHGIRLGVDMGLDEALNLDYDMVVLPGGMPGAGHLQEDERIMTLLKKMAESKKFTGAICAAPKVLAEAGLLKGKKATSFPGFLDDSADQVGDYVEESVVQDGKVITSRGPGTAMDFALHLIEQLAGKAKRDEVEGRLQRP
ncbi:4-methyl-5(b-hydroxyethyl)-thiazole monophosphate biosynthesis [Natronospira proteinivora]|uniref:4-methyl-5(B-hydroxyethyl)-thiazole monophosphate biosynthesis n=1 Tax=Natronospira proteinivora TaxID=1807133 RepID=A0ABT1GB23_9GAMM|nr:DJ-1 family glyoxalase III [Natronospira proteinivora]MCP1728110.1 4-methyl-5(b-hydroxyethyl)-thiazole monophosphate biosynthesis [Natronospira proteinivora]